MHPSREENMPIIEPPKIPFAVCSCLGRWAILSNRSQLLRQKYMGKKRAIRKANLIQHMSGFNPARPETLQRTFVRRSSSHARVFIVCILTSTSLDVITFTAESAVVPMEGGVEALAQYAFRADEPANTLPRERLA
jgi:hypothetical protein